MALLLAFLLLVSNSGVALNVHYCGGKIAAITTAFSKDEVCQMEVEQEQSCCAKAETNHKKCCSDKEVNLDDDTEKIVIKSFSIDLDAPFVINEWSSIVYNTASFQINSQCLDYYCQANAPPLYKLYSQYIYYA